MLNKENKSSSRQLSASVSPVHFPLHS